MKNNCKLHNGRIKRGNTNHRSYVGYYKNYYLRSKCEFVIARWLDIHNLSTLYEDKIYTVENVNYKPDFFHIVNGRIRTIIEVKHSKKEAIKYFNKYNDVFASLGIRYLVVWSKHINKIIKKHNLQDEVESWIKTSINAHSTIDMSGKNNPKFGTKASAETKRKIGESTKERASSPEYRLNLSKSICKFYKTDAGIAFREKLSKLRKERAKQQRLNKNKTDPIIIGQCATCGDLFEFRSVSDRNRKTCRKNGCTTRYNTLIGKPRKPLPSQHSIKSYKTRLIKYGKLLQLHNISNVETLDEQIKFRKLNNKEVPLTFGISMYSICKYFGSWTDYIQEIRR